MAGVRPLPTREALEVAFRGLSAADQVSHPRHRPRSARHASKSHSLLWKCCLFAREKSEALQTVSLRRFLM